ncbi:hypothetical protein EJB05_10278, partial [Eragrostis curvula]
MALHRSRPRIVHPDCSFCTIGDDGEHFHRIPGLPHENATCLGATDDWLALDCADDVFRRTPHWDTFSDNMFATPRPDVKHRHTYLLHNPFSGETVPLPELDSVVGHVAETFQIRKVLMRSSSPDDLVAVTTNNWNYNVILCHPWSWKYHDDSSDEDDTSDNSSSDDDDSDDGQLSAASNEEEQGLDEDAPNQEDDSSFNGDDMVPNGEVTIRDQEVPYEPKDYICTIRYLVKSRGVELLLMIISIEYIFYNLAISSG